MKKRYAFLLSSTILLSSSIAFFGSNDNQIANSLSLNSNNHDSRESKIVPSNSTLAFGGLENNYSTTPYGYFNIDKSSLTIYNVSYFGNISWSYNLKTSNFLKRAGTINSIENLNAVYIEDVDRIVVFGKVNNTNQFLFQLNAKDGSEYYVNKNNKTPESSSLFNEIEFGKITYLGNGVIALLPFAIESNINMTIRNKRVNLDTYLTSPMVFELNNSNTDLYNSYKFGRIIDYVESVDKSNNYFLVQTIEYDSHNPSSTKGKLGIMVISINDDLKYKSHEFLNFQIIIQRDWYDVFLNDYYFGSKYLRKSNGITETYIMYNNKQNTSAFSYYYGFVTDAPSINNNGKTINANVSICKSLDRNTESNSLNRENYVYLVDLFNDKKNGKMYAFAHDKDQWIDSNWVTQEESHSLNYYLFELTGQNIENLHSNVNLAPLYSGNGYKKNLFYIKFIDDSMMFQNSTSQNLYRGIYSVQTINHNNNGQITETRVGSFTINPSLSNSIITFDNDFYPTEISGYESLANDNPKLLPQDVTLDTLSKYIYLHKPNSTEKVHESLLTLDNPLDVDNTNGTLTGEINLNLKKWWLTNSNKSEYVEVPIKINISGLATNAGLNFQIVISQNINSQKYQNILDLQSKKYPSQLSKDEILNNFFEYGNNLKITTNDITIISENSTSYVGSNNSIITVTTNDKSGILHIEYDLTPITSASAVNKHGDYTFYNFKQLNSWSPISIDLEKWNNLKKIKMPFQVTKDDVISCLNLSSSYKTDSMYWQWVPDSSEQLDKNGYIQNTLEGVVSGTIKYDRTIGGTPENIPEEYTQLSIGSEDMGSGFKNLIEEIGESNSLSVKFNKNKANEIASSFSLDDAKKMHVDIFRQSITFFNNWTNVNSINFGEPINEGNSLIYMPSFNSNIETKFLKSDGTKLILDDEWVKKINAMSTVLQFPPSGFVFEYNQATYSWNYNISPLTKEMSVHNIPFDKTQNISSSELERLMGALPSQFVDYFYNSENGSFMDFQNKMQLLNINTDVPSYNISYYKVLDISMVPNDTNGSVYIQYTLFFPNIGDSASIGKIVFPNITLTGFPTYNDKQFIIVQAFFWTFISLLTISGIYGLYTFLNRWKYTKNKNNYSHSNNLKDFDLGKKQIDLREWKSKKVRNTISFDSKNVAFDSRKTNKERKERYLFSIKESAKKSKRRK